jgi:hypothetical protein
MTFRFFGSVSVAMTGPRFIGSRAPHSIPIGFVGPGWDVSLMWLEDRFFVDMGDFDHDSVAA